MRLWAINENFNSRLDTFSIPSNNVSKLKTCFDVSAFFEWLIGHTHAFDSSPSTPKLLEVQVYDSPNNHNVERALHDFAKALHELNNFEKLISSSGYCQAQDVKRFGH